MHSGQRVLEAVTDWLTTRSSQMAANEAASSVNSGASIDSEYTKVPTINGTISQDKMNNSAQTRSRTSAEREGRRCIYEMKNGAPMELIRCLRRSLSRQADASNPFQSQNLS